MIGRGRVISLTPSGAHLGPRQELSDLLHPSALPKSAANRGPTSSPQRKRASTPRGVGALNRQSFERESEARLIPFPRDALACAEHGSAPGCAARGQPAPAERNPAAGEDGGAGPTHRCDSVPPAWRSTGTRSMQAQAHDGNSGRGSSGAYGNSGTARSRTRPDSRSSRTRRTS